MRRYIAVALILLSFGLVPTPVQGAVEVVRLEVYKPVRDVPPDWDVPQTSKTYGYRWVPLACDGTDVLNGVGTVRVIAYVNAATSRDSNAFRLTYRTNLSNEAWYQNAYPKLVAGVDTQIMDSVQDLAPSSPDVTFSLGRVGGAMTNCPFTALNIPPSSEGFVSHRSDSVESATGLQIQIFQYNTGTPLPCGQTGLTFTRVSVKLYLSPPATGTLYDLHAHVETGSALGTGPDQDGNPADSRYWEIAFEDTKLPVPPTIRSDPNLVGLMVLNTTGQRTLIHFAQQTGPGQLENEVLCSIAH